MRPGTRRTARSATPVRPSTTAPAGTSARATTTTRPVPHRPGGAGPRGPHHPPTGGMRVGQPRRRQLWLLAAVLVVLLGCAGRLVQVQLIDGARLAEQGREERSRTYPIHAARGKIVDANGLVLARSVMSYNVRVDQRQIPAYTLKDADGEVVGTGAAAAAAQLAPILGLNAHELGAALNGTYGDAIIAREVSPEVRNAIMDLGINGLTTSRVSTREYPSGTTAGSIVGWLNADNEGAAGLEYRFNEVLTGTDGSRSGEISASGMMIPGAGQTVVPAEDGQTIHLSIDGDLQQYAQQQVDATVARYEADWGALVAIEVGTGRVLALAESGMVDPNNPSGFAQLNSVQAPYDPGSTGKILTAAAAMNEGLITPTTVFNVSDTLTTSNGQVFHDHAEHPTEDLTVTGIMADSSNVGTIHIGELMTDATRTEYMKAFGLDTSSGIELTGESTGYNTDYAAWDGRTRYATMFGQGYGVNLLQNTNVIATIGNGGQRVPVHLVDGYSDAAGTFTPAEVADPVSVVSPEVAADVVRMLESVTTVEGATGTRAQIEGYRVAGKTGTAQIPDGEGGITATAASFVGLVPAEDPKLAIGVVIYRPSTGLFGGIIAAPLFADVGSFALQRLGIPPSTEQPDLYPSRPTE